jgi:hypothetical protein
LNPMQIRHSEVGTYALVGPVLFQSHFAGCLGAVVHVAVVLRRRAHNAHFF